MNNNDILNELHNNGESCQPSDRLNPNSIENLLGEVKRKSHKGLVSACVSIGIVFLTLSGVFGTALYEQISRPTLPIKANTTTKSYDNIYKIVDSVKRANEETMLEEFSKNFYMGNTNIVYDAVASQDIVTNGAESTVTNTSSNHSETNIQVTGVDEADVVKTDGKYIYSLKNKKIFITKPNNGNPEHISTIDCDYLFSEMYIYKNKLVAISNALPYIAFNQNGNIAEDEYSLNNCTPSILSSTNVVIYDLTDITSPVQTAILSQSGSYISSRRIDNIIYLTTSYRIYDLEQVKEDDPQTYCPVYGTNGDLKCVDANSISVTEMVDSIQYFTIASIDLNRADDFADICSVLGAGSDIYMSHNNLYTASCHIEDSIDKTQIMRFSLNGAEITPNGSFDVNGSLLNQFSMDEYNGYFRIVTESSEYDTSTYEYYASTISSSTQTALYVFDNDLKLVGKTENVAKGENVKSVRFDGDTAYFVTFRQTDPLFTVDLSDPTSPKILSELKIPGFSKYLHVFGDNLLFGFGREADITTGRSEGLKLTMFDISDKTNVTELATRIFTSDSTDSDAEYNHKAIFIDTEKSIIGIPYTDYDSDTGIQQYYSIFEYDKERNDFILLKNINLSNNLDHSDNLRGLYIDNYFYIVTPEKIYAFDYQNFESTNTLTFNE